MKREDGEWPNVPGGNLISADEALAVYGFSEEELAQRRQELGGVACGKRWYYFEEEIKNGKTQI